MKTVKIKITGAQLAKALSDQGQYITASLVSNAKYLALQIEVPVEQILLENHGQYLKGMHEEKKRKRFKIFGQNLNPGNESYVKFGDIIEIEEIE